MQQVGFSQTHITVQEQRVEQRLRIGEGLRHLLRRGMREPVRDADQEARESEARIERRAFEPAGARAERHRQPDRFGHRRRRHAALAERLFRYLAAKMRLPHPELDALDVRPFGAREPQHEVVVMRPEPIAEEARRDRKMEDLAVCSFELDPPEPAREHILSELCA